MACCRAAAFAPDARHTARSITSQIAMVACGLGVALVPESTTYESPFPAGEGIHLVPVKDSATIDLAAIWRKGANPLVENLLDSARAVISPRPQ